MTKQKIITKSAKQTEVLGESLGKSLKGGEIIELSSDLGGGKTTFTRGLAKGLGVNANITSPSFVVSKVYQGDLLELHHYDFYRLGDIGIMSQELQEVIDNIENVTVIEWASGAHDLLPRDRLLRIELLALDNEKSREIVLDFPADTKYLKEYIGAKKC